MTINCEHCVDPEGSPCLPQYGLAPHEHTDKGIRFLPKSEYPDNFLYNEENHQEGVWICEYCHNKGHQVIAYWSNGESEKIAEFISSEEAETFCNDNEDEYEELGCSLELVENPLLLKNNKLKLFK